MMMYPVPAPLPQHAVQVVAPPLSPSGLYEVTIWQTQDKAEGLVIRVQKKTDVINVLRVVREAYGATPLKGEDE